MTRIEPLQRISIEYIDMRAYLTKLGAGLASSMIGPKDNISVTVVADEGTLPTSHAVSLGLIVTELVINAIKYAFPPPTDAGTILVTFETAAPDWKLAVSDNGNGKAQVATVNPSGGLGTALVSALAKQLEAQISEVSTGNGLTVEVTRATLAPQVSRAA